MKKYDIGIDLGGTKVLCAIVEKESHKVLFEVKKKTKKEKGNKKIIQKLYEALDELFDISNIKKEDIESISIAAAGQINRKEGILLNGCNSGVKDLNLKEIFEEKYSIKTNLFNDVEAASIAELMLGAGVDNKNILCIFIGTGIGSSIVIDRKIYHGSTGCAGEIGHTIIDKNGRACTCGGFGCLEAYASRSAIEARIQGLVKKGKKTIITELNDKQNISTKHIKTALDAHDEVTMMCVGEAIEYLSCAIASALNFLNPDLVILGGGLIQGIDEFYLKTVKLTKTKALPLAVEHVEFKKALLGDYSGVVGAVLAKDYYNVK